jgi:drug/metabolite transporter (DMT)-like permease
MLGETFSPMAMIGVAVTMAGIIIVLVEKEENHKGQQKESPSERRRKSWGVFFGLISAIGQGFGAVLSKKGMYLDVTIAMNPLSAAFIRMMVTGLFVWAIAVLAGKLPELHRAVKDRTGIKYTAAGALVGPFVGMTLSMVAIASTETGIAQTLMSLSPVLIIPVIWVIYREKTNWRGILGAFIAIIGVAILFLT